jgi:hypothetical protein
MKFMKTNRHPKTRPLIVCAAFIAFAHTAVYAQGFNAGSDGSLGDVVISADTRLDLPPDGKLNYKSLTVNAGVRLNFNKNARNTPVFILSQGDVIIDGTIDVNGFTPTRNNGGASGPGGFDGGKPGFGAEVPPGNGYGPGGAIAGDANCDANTSAGAGSYGRAGMHGGPTYGSVLLIPIIGGSGGAGGAGQPGGGGGGGGGAILIGSNTRIQVNGRIEARGGGPGACFNGGSGGAIRLVSFRVEGTGLIDVSGGSNGGSGRIRVDTIDHSNLLFQFNDNTVTTVGGNLLTFPPTIPALATIEAAGNAVLQGGGPVTFTLPFGSSPDRTVKVQASDFGRVVPIRVTLTPDSGAPLTVDAQIDNTTVNPAVTEIPITVPVNTLVTLHVWTR